MKFTQTLVYSGSRAQVTEMLKNPEYYKNAGQHWMIAPSRLESD
ncbi:Uncharacterised protein [Mobiluncus curtisii]|uniref:Uncharacterized protein n=1 Tax=Mobiluncus curtisii TaxID=2051 RepID=A0A2X3BLB3_9ACTO|nr:Uncharacterised protein [Mobiluncus curtisii]